MRALVLKIHLLLALAAGAVITSLGVTGSIMAFEPELDHLQQRALMDVRASGNPHTLVEIGRAVSAAYPGTRIGAFTLGATRSRACAVSTPLGQVYVNPYTLEITGVRPPGPDWLANVHQMHLRLLTSWGRPLVRWSGVATVVLLVSGFYLWWPAKRTSVAAGRSPFRTWFDLHNAIGIFSLAFLLVLSLTGVFIGFDDVMLPLAYRITGSAPATQVSTKVALVPGARQITPDEAVAIAREALPGAEPFLVQVVGPADAYVVRSRFPEDLTPGGRSRVVVDSYTGRVIAAESSRTAPGGRRVEILNRAVHTGDVFGLPSKIVMSVASLMAPVQLITGVMLWLRRRNRSNVA
jgi:uncharacterized iron-regulated membrane protein